METMIIASAALGAIGGLLGLAAIIGRVVPDTAWQWLLGDDQGSSEPCRHLNPFQPEQG